MNGKLNKAEYEKRELTKEVSDMKAVLNTPLLGLANPLLKGANILAYDCSLCAQRGMNQNGIAHHFKKKHNVDRKLDILPVEGNNDEEQRFVVSTDTMEPPETSPAMGPKTAHVRPPENVPEMASNAASPPVGSQDLSSPPAPVQEQTTSRTETQQQNEGTQQLHCALIESTGCDCDFQCMTKEELNAHIETNHRNVFNCDKCEFRGNIKFRFSQSH